MDRPGNAPLTEVDHAEFKVVTSFADISVELSANSGCGKRKLDEDEVAVEPEVNKRNP